MMETQLRVYNFLDRIKVGIRAPVERLSSYEKNIQERPIVDSDYDAIIKVRLCSNKKIVKDKDYPYLWTKTKGNNTDYYKYSTLTRSIIQNSMTDYEILEYLKDDEGVLDIFRTIYCQSDASANNALIHASVLNINGKGTLIAGPCRSGKTSLTLALLENSGAELISEGISLIESEKNYLYGLYLPRQIYMRFSSISKHKKLESLLSDYNLNDSPQYLDHDAIKKIIQARAFHVDAGITVSRDMFSDLLNVRMKNKTKINSCIFTNYSPNLLGIQEINEAESIAMLKKSEFPINNTFNRVIMQNKIEHPEKSKISPTWIKGIKSKIIKFNANRHLTQSTLENLIE